MSESQEPASSPTSPFTPRETPGSSGRSAFGCLVIALLLLFLGSVLLAELGIVRMESTKTEWKAQSEFNTSWVNRRPGLLQVVVPTVKVSVPSGADRSIADHAAAAIRKSSPDVRGGAGVDITITGLTSKGAHWMPYFKGGSCKFTATYQMSVSVGGSSFQVRGQVNGDVTQSTKGLCSTRLFREYLGKAVAAAIANQVQDMIRKNG